MPSPAMIERAKKHIKQLTNDHIKMYDGRVKAAEDPTKNSQHIRVDECRYYLALWKGISAKDHAWDKLDRIEQREVIDALVELEND